MNTYIFVIAAFAAGLVLAALVAYFVTSSSRRQADAFAAQRLDDLRARYDAALAEKDRAYAAATAEKDRAYAAALAEKDRMYQELAEQREEAAKTALAEKDRAHAAALTEKDRAHAAAMNEKDRAYATTLAEKDKAAKEAIEAQQRRFDETIAKVSAQMKTVTDEMLKQRQQEFAQSSTENISRLVDPLKQNIADLRKAMDEGGKEQAERSGQMREQIRNLMEQSQAARKSAEELANAFKHGSKMQGDWGETILEELLDAQGLTKGLHYDTQAVLQGNLRPDVILHLDKRREVIIDSKVSLTAYVDYVNAACEEDRSRFLKAHLDSIRKHVKELAVKDYSSLVKAPKVSAGYVLMFVPNMGALWTALNADTTLWRWAADQNVCIVDEQTLYGALKVVEKTWTQLAQAQNHEEVYKLADEMINRVGLFLEEYKKIGVALNKAQDAYNAAEAKLDTRGQSIIYTSNKLIKLGARNSEKHPVPELIDIDLISE